MRRDGEQDRNKRAERKRGEAASRSPWWVRYGWAVTITGLLFSDWVLSCDRPLAEPVRMLLAAAGLDRTECDGDDSGRRSRQGITEPGSPPEAGR